MTTREDRFRSLPLHGRLAVVVKHLRSLLETVQATNPSGPAVPTMLWSTVEIGQSACVDRLDAEELETTERLLHQLISFDPESHRFVSPDTRDPLTAATTAALQESVYIGVRVLLAVKALQANAVEEAARELDEGFVSLVDAIDDFSAASRLTRSDGQPGDVSRAPLARLDRDIESLDDLADASDWDDSARLSPDALISGFEGAYPYDQLEPAASTDRARSSAKSRSRSSGSTGSHGHNAGLGILFMFLLSAGLSALRHLPQGNRADKPQRAAEQRQQQQAQWDGLRRQQMQLGVEQLRGMRAIMTVQNALQEAEQANQAGDQGRADAALQKARSELEQVPGIDTLGDTSAEILVRLAWQCGDLLQSRDPEQALSTYDRGCQLASELLERRGTSADRSCLAALLNNKSNVLRSLGRHEETVEPLSQAVELQTAALQAEPRNDTYRTYLRHHLSNQTHSCLALKRWKEAAQAAQQWCELSSKNEEAWYESACRLAEVATAIREGAEEGELRSELVGQLVLQATELLKMARGPDVRIEDEIARNASLEILGTPLLDAPRQTNEP